MKDFIRAWRVPGVSLPARIIATEIIDNKGLDYGCGFTLDAAYYAQVIGQCEKYDPFIEDYKAVPSGNYTHVFCTYVLNVVPPDVQLFIVGHIARLINVRDGVAYFTVRRDIPIDSQGPNQWWVNFNQLAPDIWTDWQTIKSNQKYEIIRLTMSKDF